MSDAAMSVTIEWFGCATFRVRAGELTLFFDTYLDKAPGVPPAGLRAAEVDRADFLFISHAHFDHLYGADIIAKATGATLVGNYESVRLMRANGVPDAQIVATAGGDAVDCGHGVTVRALPSQHSGLYAAGSPDSGQDCLGDLGVSAQERQARTQAIFGRVFTASDEDRAYFDLAGRSTSSYDGGQLAYLLESPAGSLLVSASAGYWRSIFAPLRPDVAILGATGRPVLDGEPYQGSLADFLAEEAAVLGRPEVIFCHYDPLLPPVFGATDITAAETRLEEVPGQGYRRLEYGAPTAILPKRLWPQGLTPGRVRRRNQSRPAMTPPRGRSSRVQGHDRALRALSSVVSAQRRSRGQGRPGSGYDHAPP